MPRNVLQDIIVKKNRNKKSQLKRHNKAVRKTKKKLNKVLVNKDNNELTKVPDLVASEIKVPQIAHRESFNKNDETKLLLSRYNKTKSLKSKNAVTIAKRKNAPDLVDTEGNVVEVDKRIKTQSEKVLMGGSPPNLPVDSIKEMHSALETELDEKRANNAPDKSPFPNSFEVVKKITARTQKRYKYWLGILMMTFLLYILFSNIFAGATIEYTAKEADLLLDNAKITASIDSGSLDIAFGLMRDIEEVNTIEVLASGFEEREEYASGKIRIYNEFSSLEQGLIKNTRFETPDGKIYRIQKSITVPGAKIENGEQIPGSIEAIVYADEPGEKFNNELTDFTVPGFKGSPRFDKFYARSVTLMEGGFKGTVSTISDDDIEAAKVKLTSELRKRLFARATSEKPDKFVLYDDGIFIKYDEVVVVGNRVGSDTVLLSRKAELYGVIFSRSALEAYIAGIILPGENTNSVNILNIEEFVFAINGKIDIDPNNVSEISFVLSGNPHVIWQVDEEKLKLLIQGIKRTEFNEIISGVSSISESSYVLRPFWKRSFPLDVDDVKIMQSEK